MTEMILKFVYLDFKEDDIIFPNPAKDILFIGLRQKEIREIRLVDASGASKPINSADYGDKTGINISHLPAGIYRLHLLRNGKWKILSFIRKGLYRKTLSAGTGPAGIGIDKMKALATQTVRKVKGCIEKIEYTLSVGHQPNTFVLKNLISRFQFMVEIHLVAES